MAEPGQEQQKTAHPQAELYVLCISDNSYATAPNRLHNAGGRLC